MTALGNWFAIRRRRSANHGCGRLPRGAYPYR